MYRQVFCVAGHTINIHVTICIKDKLTILRHVVTFEIEVIPKHTNNFYYIDQ